MAVTYGVPVYKRMTIGDCLLPRAQPKCYIIYMLPSHGASGMITAAHPGLNGQTVFMETNSVLPPYWVRYQFQLLVISEKSSAKKRRPAKLESCSSSFRVASIFIAWTVLRRVFGPKRDEVTGEWRKLHNEELSDLYSLTNWLYINYQLDALNIIYS